MFNFYKHLGNKNKKITNLVYEIRSILIVITYILASNLELRKTNSLFPFFFQVTSQSIFNYIKACGFGMVIFTVITTLLTIAAQVFSSIWLSFWASDEPVDGKQDIEQRNYRLGVYGGLGILQG